MNKHSPISLMVSMVVGLVIISDYRTKVRICQFENGLNFNEVKNDKKGRSSAAAPLQ
jgi:hypothetical protein